MNVAAWMTAYSPSEGGVVVHPFSLSFEDLLNDVERHALSSRERRDIF